MTQVLFATSAGYPHLTPDDKIAAAALEQLGIRVAPAIWNATHPDQVEAEAVIVRSCWDYHLHLTAFVAWVEGLERAGIRIVNSVDLIRWNLHKRYLLDLEHRGVKIIPLVVVERSSSVTLREILELSGWAEVVVKPAVSLSAYQTWRISDWDTSTEQLFCELKSTRDLLVQPYIRAVETSGEWSLVFFGGKHSHSVRKRPKDGDFRVQTEHGGSVEIAVAPPPVLSAAERVISSLGATPTYARVDGVFAAGEFLLMEMECIDPVLFFETQPQAATRFAEEIAEQLVGDSIPT